MSHVALLIAYDGTSYLGWQKTKEGNSVEGTLEQALAQIFQEPITLQAASRTDRGVHALGQVVDFTTSRKIPNIHRLLVGINSLLPTDIRVLSLHEVPAGFHPTLDVTSKVYRYSISLGPVQLPSERLTHWHVHVPLSLPILYEASRELIGTHDFRGFTNYRKGPRPDDMVRTIFRIDIDPHGHRLEIAIEGNNFLYRMCRNLVGTMVFIAAGKTPRAAIQKTFASQKRADAGITAPSHGLTLFQVKYANGILL